MPSTARTLPLNSRTRPSTSMPLDMARHASVGGMRELFRIPIVQAPLAGGPSTPQLAAAVCEAGGLGFVAAGYKTPEQMSDAVAQVRALTEHPFGVNVFAGAPTQAPGVGDFAARLRADGLEPGEPRS